MSILCSLVAAVSSASILAPVVTTEAVPHDADDPAIWVCRDGSKSLILGTDKEKTNGGIYVFDLEGKIVQTVAGLDRPNNVDVAYDFQLGAKAVDLAVVTERGKKRLRVFAIDKETGKLTDVSGATGVFAERSEADAVPMGISVTKDFVAIVSPKSGPKVGYLSSYQMVESGGKVDLKPVQDLGVFSGSGEIESVFVDNSSNSIYYSDESFGIRVARGFGGNLTDESFGTSDYQGDREGLAAHTQYLISSDQIDLNTRLHVYDRAAPNKPVCVIPTSADETDGLDATDKPLGDKFPKGILVMMNSSGKNFQIYDWRDVEKAIKLSSR